MAGGSEIKSTLTLDVSKFSSALESAVAGTESLEKHLKSAAKVAADFDKGMAGVGSDLAGTAKNFRLLDQSVEGMVSKLSGVVHNFEQLSRRTGSVAGDVERLGSAMKKTAGINADEWIKTYGDNLGKLTPALKQTVASIIDFDRANIASAETAKKTAATTVEAKLKALNAEREGNRKIIAEREQTMRELAAIEERAQKRSDAAYTDWRNRKKKDDELRGKATAAQEAANAAAIERAALESVVKEIRWKNAEIDKSIALIRQEGGIAQAAGNSNRKEIERTKNARIDADRRMLDGVKRAETERIKSDRKVAEAHKKAVNEMVEHERLKAQQVANVWANVRRWSGSKLMQGLGMAVEKSAEMQQIQLRPEAFGLKGAELEEFNKKAFDLRRQEKYLSNLDAIQARFTAMASLGHNDVRIIDATTGKSIQTVQALKTLGYEHGNVTDIQRNLYGIAEMRQVMNDPAAINKTFDTAFRMANVSGGKITLADIETVLRNLGAGANKISDTGLMNLAALAEQAKVSGGHGGSGGGGAGVSSVGNMIKMAQLYALGKPIPTSLVEKYMEAGLMAGDISSLDMVKGGKKEHTAMLNAMKRSGLKNADMIAEDPVTALWNMRAPLLEFMQNKNHRAEYFGKSDINDPKTQLTAFMKFFAQSGMSHRAVSQMVTAMNPAYHERTKHVTDSAMNGMGAEEALKNAEAMKNWSLAVQEMKKGIEDLMSSFTPLLGELSVFPKTIGAMAASLAGFAKDNPMIASFAAITLGAAGLNLTFTTLLGTFGKAQNISSVMANVWRSMVGGATQAQASTAAATTAMAGFGRQATIGAGAAYKAALAKEATAKAAKFAAAEELKHTRAVVAASSGVARLRATEEMLVPAKQKVIAATNAHTAAKLAVTAASDKASIAARAQAGAMTVLRGAMALVGGPIGAITVGLMLGVAAWNKWGGAAETAWDKAVNAGEKRIKTLEDRIDEFHKKSRNMQVAKQAGYAGDDEKVAEAYVELRDLEKIKEEALAREKRLGASGSAYHTLNERRIKVTNRDGTIDYTSLNERIPYLKELLNKVDGIEQAEAILAKLKTKAGLNQDSEIAGIINDIKKGADGGNPHQFENAWISQFSQANSRANIAQLKLDSLISGNASYEKQAEQEVIAMWASGKFDDGGNPNHRPFLKGAQYDEKGKITNKTYDPLRGWDTNDIDLDAKRIVGTLKDENGKDVKGKDGKPINVEKSLNDLIELLALRKKEEAALKDLGFAKQRSAALDEDMEVAMSRLTGETEGQTDAMKALNREFARAEKRTPDTLKSDNHNAEKQAALIKRATVDYANMSADLVQKNTEMEAQFLETERERLLAGVNATFEAEQKKMRIVMESMSKRIEMMEEEIAAMEAAGKKETEAYKTAVEAYSDAIEAKKKGEREFDRFKRNLEQKRDRDSWTGLQKMVDSWDKAYDRLNEFGERWASNFANELGTLITTGKADWRSFVSSMMAELSKLALNKALAGMLGGANGVGGGGLGGVVKGLLGWMGGGGAGKGAGFAASVNNSPYSATGGSTGLVAGSSVLDGALSGGGGAGGAEGVANSFVNLAANSDILNESFGSFSMIADMANEALQDTTDQGVMGFLGGLWQSITGMFTKQSAEQAEVVALTTLTAAAQAAASALLQVAASSTASSFGGMAANGAYFDGGMSFFANGGAFTNGIYADPTLFRFANGGKFGVMGEAGPEAVMPLSRDGKGRLGVTVNEGMVGSADNTVVNIAITVNNNEGGGKGESESGSGDEASGWKQFSNRIKSLVVEELASQKRPGGLLYG
ncbi:MAG: hypothetical protein FWF12_00495 [Betaproteobacteria bacterium]|nr:hypothetical protein [Betaproteobacteria bacterium]